MIVTARSKNISSTATCIRAKNKMFCGTTVGVRVLVVGTEDDVRRKVPTNDGCVVLSDAVCNSTEDGDGIDDVFVCVSIIGSLYCRHSG